MRKMNEAEDSSQECNQSTFTIYKNRYLDKFKLQATLLLDTLAFTKTSDARIIALPGHLEIQFENSINIKNGRADGAAGEVFTAEFINNDSAFDSFFPTGEPRVVAVKLFKDPRNPELYNIWKQETSIIWALNHHPNVVKLVAYSIEPFSIVRK